MPGKRSTHCLRQCRLPISPGVSSRHSARSTSLEVAKVRRGDVSRSPPRPLLKARGTRPHAVLHPNHPRVRLRHEDEATALCKGIVLGLYRAEQRGFELLEYAEDGPSELAGQAVAIWRRRRCNVSLPRTLLRSSHPSGLGSLANGRDVKPTVSPQSPRCRAPASTPPSSPIYR